MRMDKPNQMSQLIKLLLIGEGKCGKTDFAGMAGAFGFQVLYLDGDVASQTLADLPAGVKRNIYLLKCGDALTDSGGIDPTYALFFKDFINQPRIVWNDSHQRQHSVVLDGQVNETDEYSIIRPAKMNQNDVLVLEWTTLARSASLWAANAYGVDLGEITDTDDRKSMRNVYQSANEKLTDYLVAIQRMPCHVICIGHPSEFVKLMDPPGRSVGSVKERDKIIAWTKMVPKSSSNNHGLSMAKYFTDVAWLEPDVMGTRFIDFTLSNQRIGGGHFSAKYQIANRDKGEKLDGAFNFATLVRKIGGTIPASIDSAPATDRWLTIQTGYTIGVKVAAAKATTPAAAAQAGGTLTAAQKPTPVKGVISLAGLINRGPAK